MVQFGSHSFQSRCY
uniref:Uncharacterized protein n=1 Tax=Anguilla anguilla TaxID=7936 RepID=A0A0E9SPL0_ANGAN